MAAPRKTAPGRAAPAVAVVLASGITTAPPASAHPLPGRVTGAVGVHDPSAVRNADGTPNFGTPNFGTPVPLGVQLPAPSGE